MGQNTSPARLSWNTLPNTPADCHQALVDLFGQFLMDIRKTVAENSWLRLTDDEKRARMPKLTREVYEKLASLETEQKRDVCDFAKAHGDRMIQQLLFVLTSQGTDIGFGPDHAIRFRLDVEILDRNSGEVVREEPINRGGSKAFYDYWGRWLNRYGAGNT